jgi:hypothetical protein
VAAGPPPRPRSTNAGQRAHLEELRETTRDKLAQLAESRRAMLLDGTAAEVKAVETEQASLTADLDRVRDSLVELDRREAAAETKAAAAERKRRELELDDKLTELGAADAELADLVTAAEPILGRVDDLEREIVALASSVGRSFGDLDRRRPLFSRLCCGRLDVKVAAFYVSPTDLVGIEERLRKAPVAPAPRTRESRPDRGPVPFVEGEETTERDFAAEQMIAARKKQAELMNANR